MTINIFFTNHSQWEQRHFSVVQLQEIQERWQEKISALQRGIYEKNLEHCCSCPYADPDGHCIIRRRFKMRKLTPILAITIIICFSVQAWHPTFAGTWRDDFEDKDTREWKIFNIDRQVEKWWVSNGEAVGEIFLPGFMSLWLTGELTWKNYSLSCRAKIGGRQKRTPEYRADTSRQRRGRYPLPSFL